MQRTSSKSKIITIVIICAVLVALNMAVYFREFTRHITLRGYLPGWQLLYEPDYAIEGIAQDTLIRDIIRDRTVLVPREERPYSEYPYYGHRYKEGNLFSFEYYTENNYLRYFREYAGAVIVDEILPDVYDISRRGGTREGFTNLGQGYDMLRYSFLANHHVEEVNDCFYYTFQYTVDPYYQHEDMLNINVAAEGLDEADTLVALWDDGENLYLMSESYYREHGGEVFHE